MLASTSINSNLVLLLIGAFIGILVVQGILGSLRGIWAPVQQPLNQSVGGGNGNGIFYLLILVLAFLYFSGFLSQNGNQNPSKPLNPINYEENQPQKMGFSTTVPQPAPQLEPLDNPEESAERELHFDYPVKSVKEDVPQEPALPRMVIQYLASNNFEATLEKVEQLGRKYPNLNIYIAEQEGYLPYKILIGDFASEYDARGFLKNNNLRDPFIRLLSDYQLVEY